MQIGLHVVGNNIANANTPGYVRERAIFAPAPVQKLGNLTIGLGVKVTGIVQSINQFAEERLRDAGGDRAECRGRKKPPFATSKAFLDSLGQSNVSTKLTDFFNAIENINNAPDNVPVKKLAIDAGRELAQNDSNAAAADRRKARRSQYARRAGGG